MSAGNGHSAPGDEHGTAQFGNLLQGRANCNDHHGQRVVRVGDGDNRSEGKGNRRQGYSPQGRQNPSIRPVRAGSVALS